MQDEVELIETFRRQTLAASGVDPMRIAFESGRRAAIRSTRRWQMTTAGAVVGMITVLAWPPRSRSPAALPQPTAVAVDRSDADRPPTPYRDDADVQLSAYAQGAAVFEHGLDALPRVGGNRRGNAATPVAISTWPWSREEGL